MNKKLIKKYIPRKIIDIGYNYLIDRELKKNKEIIIRPNTTDKKIFGQIFVQKEHKLPFKINPKIIIDVGSYTGISVLYFAKQYPNAKIIAIEPEESNFETLVMNTKHNPNIKCIQAGLSNIPGFLEVIDRKNGEWGFTTEQINNKTEKSVRAITIQEIMKENKIKKIDLLKIDIEGNEQEVFENNYEWLNKVDTLIIELHDFLIERPNCAENFHKAIKNFNFNKMKFSEGLILRKNE